jgi:hypothetical protein
MDGGGVIFLGNMHIESGICYKDLSLLKKEMNLYEKVSKSTFKYSTFN